MVKRLDGVAAGLAAALEELREIARGIHPAVLAERGLRPALGVLARRCPVPVELRFQVPGRLPDPVEIAAYYVVSEALTNTAKHARATTATVDVAVAGLAENGMAAATAAAGATADQRVLRVSVHDDGRGGADFGAGSGLVGLRDRVEAIGGHFGLDGSRDGGTTLDVRIPLKAEHFDRGAIETSDDEPGKRPRPGRPASGVLGYGLQGLEHDTSSLIVGAAPGLAVCGRPECKRHPLHGRPRPDLNPYEDGEVTRSYICNKAAKGCGKTEIETSVQPHAEQVPDPGPGSTAGPPSLRPPASIQHRSSSAGSSPLRRHRAACPFEARPGPPPASQARRHRCTDRSDTRSSAAISGAGIRCSNFSTAASRTSSRRLRPSAVKPPPCAYLIDRAYRQKPPLSAPPTS